MPFFNASEHLQSLLIRVKWKKKKLKSKEMKYTITAWTEIFLCIIYHATKIKLQYVQLNTQSNFLSSNNFMTKCIKLSSFDGMSPIHINFHLSIAWNLKKSTSKCVILNPQFLTASSILIFFPIYLSPLHLKVHTYQVDTCFANNAHY